MKKWRGMDIYECPECGYSTVDKEQYEIHTAQTGHEKVEIPAEDQPQETQPEPEDEAVKEVKNVKGKK